RDPVRAGVGRGGRAAGRPGAPVAPVRAHAVLRRVSRQPEPAGGDVRGGGPRPARLAARPGLPPVPARERPRGQLARRGPGAGAHGRSPRLPGHLPQLVERPAHVGGRPVDRPGREPRLVARELPVDAARRRGVTGGAKADGRRRRAPDGISRAGARASRERVAVTVAALEELVAIPSVSGDPARRGDVERAAAWLAARLGSLGGRVVPTGGHPLVLGEWLGAEGAPTVLIYAHYDVQPAGEEGAWQTPPFEPAVRGERMYGRGTSDDKGPMLAALGAVERLLEERGRLPVNVRILLEGEEEIGSPNLEAALAANRNVLRADVAVSADGAMWSAEQPSVNVAARGMVAVEVAVRGPAADLHSGRHGGAAQNPLRALAAILATLHRADGSVAVDGFSDDVVRLTAADREEIGQMPFDDDAYRDEIGVPELHGESAYTPLERLTARPTLEVSQIEGGGRYTVIPAVARAYLTCRLVPDQDPARVAAAIARHAIHHCPPGVTVSVEEVPTS